MLYARAGLPPSKPSCYRANSSRSTSKLRDLFPSCLPRFLYSFREWRYEIKADFVIITAMFTEFWLSFSKGKFSQENHWTDSSVASCLQSTHIRTHSGAALCRPCRSTHVHYTWCCGQGALTEWAALESKSMGGQAGQYSYNYTHTSIHPSKNPSTACGPKCHKFVSYIYSKLQESIRLWIVHLHINSSISTRQKHVTLCIAKQSVA